MDTGDSYEIFCSRFQIFFFAVYFIGVYPAKYSVVVFGGFFFFQGIIVTSVHVISVLSVSIKV